MWLPISDQNPGTDGHGNRDTGTPGYRASVDYVAGRMRQAGYAVTIHKAQGATVDRVYALADPMMNRNAAYVALTRHREGVHLYADRKTFGGRQQLDRVLSRESRKDLARDYAAADLGRLVSRIQGLHERAESIRVEQRGLWGTSAGAPGFPELAAGWLDGWAGGGWLAHGRGPVRAVARSNGQKGRPCRRR